jgi:hypothetical protein
MGTMSMEIYFMQQPSLSIYFASKPNIIYSYKNSSDDGVPFGPVRLVIQR